MVQTDLFDSSYLTFLLSRCIPYSSIRSIYYSLNNGRLRNSIWFTIPLPIQKEWTKAGRPVPFSFPTMDEEKWNEKCNAQNPLAKPFKKVPSRLLLENLKNWGFRLSLLFSSCLGLENMICQTNQTGRVWSICSSLVTFQVSKKEWVLDPFMPSRLSILFALLALLIRSIQQRRFRMILKGEGSPPPFSFSPSWSRLFPNSFYFTAIPYSRHTSCFSFIES